MYSIERTDSSNPDFQQLVAELDKDLAIRDGDEHPFFAQFNKIDAIKYAVVLYQDGQATGCGAIKHLSDGVMEVKRMYVLPGSRGAGLATHVLAELEAWARELGYAKCMLETGWKQPEAIRLYEKSKYARIPNYGQYADVASSVCFEKLLAEQP